MGEERKKRDNESTMIMAAPPSISPTLNAIKLVTALPGKVRIARAIELNDRVFPTDGFRTRRTDAMASSFTADRRKILR